MVMNQIGDTHHRRKYDDPDSPGAADEDIRQNLPLGVHEEEVDQAQEVPDASEGDEEVEGGLADLPKIEEDVARHVSQLRD